MAALAVVLGGASAAQGLTAPRTAPQDSLSRLRAEVAASSARLATATAAWEEGQRHLGELLQRKHATGQLAEELQLEAAESRDRMQALANSLYRNPVDPMMAAVLRGDVQGISSVQMGRRALGITVDDQRRAAYLLENSARDVTALLQEQDDAAREAIKQQLKLDDQLAAIQSEANASLARLTAALEEARRQREAAARLGTGPGATCNAPLPEGAINGFLPISALCPLPSAPGHRLVVAAADAFNAMNAAYRADTGTDLCVTDSYRDYAGQVAVFAVKPNLAATPGRSNHGWGRALDLCGGVQTFGTAPYLWLKAHAGEYGWGHPDWAEPGGSRPEPWHWEFQS